MQIDVTQPIVGYDDEPLTIPSQTEKTEGGKAKEEQLILKKAICDALLASFRDEERVSGAEKAKRFELAKRVNKCDGEFEFSGDEIDLIKSMVAKMYATLISGAIWSMLEEAPTS